MSPMTGMEDRSFVEGVVVLLATSDPATSPSLQPPQLERQLANQISVSLKPQSLLAKVTSSV
jgi:hypothetical protein